MGAFGSIHRIGNEIKGKREGREGNFDLYQIGTEAAKRKSEEFGGEFAAECVAAEAQRGEKGGAGAGERVEDEVAFVGGGKEDAFEERDGLLRGMLAEALFPSFGRIDFPDGLHLLAAVRVLHQFVVEGVARLGVFGGPNDGFGGVGKIAARKIGRRIGLHPRDVVQELEAELLHGEADGMDDVGGAGNPDGAVGFEDTLAGSEPRAIKFVIRIRSAGFVPVAFVDGDHFAGVAGDAAVGEEVRRVSEDQVDGGFRDGGEDFQAVALVDTEVMLGVVEGWSWKSGHFLDEARPTRKPGVWGTRTINEGAQPGVAVPLIDQSGSLIRRIRESRRQKWRVASGEQEKRRSTETKERKADMRLPRIHADFHGLENEKRRKPRKKRDFSSLRSSK